MWEWAGHHCTQNVGVPAYRKHNTQNQTLATNKSDVTEGCLRNLDIADDLAEGLLWPPPTVIKKPEPVTHAILKVDGIVVSKEKFPGFERATKIFIDGSAYDESLRHIARAGSAAYQITSKGLHLSAKKRCLTGSLKLKTPQSANTLLCLSPLTMWRPCRILAATARTSSFKKAKKASL